MTGNNSVRYNCGNCGESYKPDDLSLSDITECGSVRCGSCGVFLGCDLDAVDEIFPLEPENRKTPLNSKEEALKSAYDVYVTQNQSISKYRFKKIVEKAVRYNDNGFTHSLAISVGSYFSWRPDGSDAVPSTGDMNEAVKWIVRNA